MILSFELMCKWKPKSKPKSELGEKTIAVYSLKEEATKDKDQAHEEAKDLLEFNGILFDKLLCVDDIPMDPRHHSKVEYGILRKTLTENNLI